MIRKFVEAKSRVDSSVTLWGDGSPTREFMYVEDAAEAILLAAEHYESSEPVNVGTGREITIKELVEKIRRYIGFDGMIEWDRTMPNGQPRRCLDTTRAREAFRFEAQVGLDEGLRRTIEWYASTCGWEKGDSG